MNSTDYKKNEYYSGDRGPDRLRHGKGIQYWADGSYYEGEWEYNLPHGQGIFKEPNGNVYDGMWVEGFK
jgi:hypothetical protein